jgi:hypothetical protein
MLREAEVALSQGLTVGQIFRQLSISEQSFYRWRKQYGGLKISQVKRMKDKLIEKEKLDQSWENTLSQVDVFKRGTEEKYEIVVSFERTEGDPKVVYIFLNTSGKYVGSNFTGE